VYHIRVIWCNETPSKIPGDEILTLCVQLIEGGFVRRPDSTGGRGLKLCFSYSLNHQWLPCVSGDGLQVGDIRHEVA
jgi:hypothetical protein